MCASLMMMLDKLARREVGMVEKDKLVQNWLVARVLCCACKVDVIRIQKRFFAVTLTAELKPKREGRSGVPHLLSAETCTYSHTDTMEAIMNACRCSAVT